MTATTAAPPRILTLDIVRGVAVMGILAMNIVDFAMPGEAYVNPRAYGWESGADFASWVFSFILIDGKMRGLFSFLFGASTLLVIEGARRKGESAASVHYRRMLWLLVFGLLHFYLVWHGDILFGYALAGLLLYFFRDREPKTLIRWGAGLVLFQFLIFALFTATAFAASAPGASPELVEGARDLNESFAVPSAAKLQETLALYGGHYGGILHHRLTEQAEEPLVGSIVFLWETLGYMLFGMAALKTGFLSGDWEERAYRQTAVICLGICVPVYAAFAYLLARDDFSPPMMWAFWATLPILIRPVMILGTAALIILLTRGHGALVGRIAAAGRCAFTNYLGTSILMTTLFFGYGFGLFGQLSRVELWLVVLPMWALMLLWSKPWLDRHQYGPFEWLWRSLARWSPQPMRRPAAAAAE
jgi:uncharacterized protein